MDTQLQRNLMEVESCARKDYIGMHRVQTAELQHDEGQEKAPRQNGDQEVLPVLSAPHGS